MHRDPYAHMESSQDVLSQYRNALRFNGTRFQCLIKSDWKNFKCKILYKLTKSWFQEPKTKTSATFSTHQTVIQIFFNFCNNGHILHTSYLYWFSRLTFKAATVKILLQVFSSLTDFPQLVPVDNVVKLLGTKFSAELSQRLQTTERWCSL